eukprot:2656617-Amphidinium_carterae.2
MQLAVQFIYLMAVGSAWHLNQCAKDCTVIFNLASRAKSYCTHHPLSLCPYYSSCWIFKESKADKGNAHDVHAFGGTSP